MLPPSPSSPSTTCPLPGDGPSCAIPSTPPIPGLGLISIPHQLSIPPEYTPLFDLPTHRVPSSREPIYSLSSSSSHNSDYSLPVHTPSDPVITSSHMKVTLSLPFVFPSPSARPSLTPYTGASLAAHWGWPWFNEDATYCWEEHTAPEREWQCFV